MNSFAVQRDEKGFSVIAKAVFEMKRLSTASENRSNEELFPLVFSLPTLYKPSFKFFGHYWHQKSSSLCESLLLFYLARASARFRAKLKTIKRAKARGSAVLLLMSIIVYDIQNLRNVAPLGTDTDSSAVAVQVNLTTDGSDFSSNWSSTPFPISFCRHLT